MPNDHPTSGSIQWHTPADADDGAAAAPKSFYERSCFRMVRTGEVLGVVSPPPAEPALVSGAGGSAAATSGGSAVRLGDGILRDARNRLIAQRDGVLVITRDRADVLPQLEIPGAVDFSTGNIDFTGNVVVHKGVGDRFSVRATGQIIVHGRVEAAALDAGEDIVLHRGMTGRERGTIRCGGDLVAHYLDAVAGDIDGTLRIEREAVNCRLAVRRGIDAPHATLLGGTWLLASRIRLGTLGSAAGAGTELVLGVVPKLDAALRAAEQRLEQQTQSREPLELERRQLLAQPQRTAAQRERLTEIEFELQSFNDECARQQRQLDTLAQHRQRLQQIDLHVSRAIHAGTRLTFAGQTYRLRDSLPGPLQISADRGQLMCRLGNQPAAPLAQLLTRRAA